METRILVGYALIAFLAIGAAVLVWALATRESRRIGRQRLVRNRWLARRRPPPPVEVP